MNVNAVSKGAIVYGATIIAHEFGHTFGFQHDGDSSGGTSSCGSYSGYHGSSP